MRKPKCGYVVDNFFVLPVEWREMLDAGILEVGFSLSELEREKMLSHLIRVKEYGKTTNLVSKRDLNLLVEKHLLPSLAGLHLLPEKDAKVMDLGSGAGFPGIAVDVASSNNNFTLLEANQKKARILEKIVIDLKLVNANVCRKRAEDVKEQEYDVILARSVAPLKRLQELALPLLKYDGRLIAWKGSNLEKEINDIKAKRMEIERIEKFNNSIEIIVLKK